MAKTLKDYPINFPYGATSAPYSKSHPHRGNDRAAPAGTPIVIGGTTIGLVGSTGLSTGNHTHTQAGTDLACQKTVDPAPYEFKPGKVVNLRTTDEKQWGKFVTIQVGKMYITYAHLSQVNVKVGDTIKQGGEMLTLNRARILAFGVLGDIKNALSGRRDADLKKHHVGKKTAEQAIDEFYNSKEGKNWREKTLPNLVREASKVDGLTKVIKAKDTEIKRLNALVGDTTKWETLKTLIRELVGK